MHAPPRLLDTELCFPCFPESEHLPEPCHPLVCPTLLATLDASGTPVFSALVH